MSVRRLLTFVAFIASHVIEAPIAIVAFIGGVVALFVIPLVSRVRA